MCLLFSRINNEADGDEYKLILVNNRDEYWKRPTKLAQFWPHNPSCISGLDDEPGRGGGTWLGMNVDGRIGVLLNILGKLDPTKKGRGFMVSDYITSDEGPDTYLSRLAVEKSSYNGFHLILFDYRSGKFDVKYLTNSLPECDSLPSKENISISNSSCLRPWQKVVHSQSGFESIVKRFPSTEQKGELVDGLFQFMCDRTPFYPDPVLLEMGGSDNYSIERAKQQSARYVWSPEVEYGTRTTTVILVSGSGYCDYFEKTLKTPVDVNNPDYILKSYNFDLQRSP